MCCCAADTPSGVNAKSRNRAPSRPPAPVAATRYSWPIANGKGRAHPAPVRTVGVVRPLPFHTFLTRKVTSAKRSQHSSVSALTTMPTKRIGAYSANWGMSSTLLNDLLERLSIHGPQQSVAFEGAGDMPMAESTTSAITESLGTLDPF